MRACVCVHYIISASGCNSVTAAERAGDPPVEAII